MIDLISFNQIDWNEYSILLETNLQTLLDTCAIESIEEEEDEFKKMPANMLSWGILVDNRLVGRVSIHSIRNGSHIGNNGQICIWLDKNSQGKGVGKEVVSQIIQKLSEADINTIFYNTFSSNKSSIALAEALGFAFVGKFKDEVGLEGRPFVQYYFNVKPSVSSSHKICSYSPKIHLHKRKKKQKVS